MADVKLANGTPISIGNGVPTVEQKPKDSPTQGKP